jgi:cell volume regulation protein A
MGLSITAFFALLGGLLVLAFVANRLAERTRVPDAVVLIATGVLLGPVSGLVQADRFRDAAHGFGTLTLLLVLFEGGLELDVRETLRHFPGGLALAFLGYALSLGSVALVARFGLDLSPLDSLLVGAVFGCVSSTIVLPVLQQIPLRRPVKLTLLVEASLGDVLAVLTVGSLLNLTAHGGPIFQGLVGGFFFEIGVSLIFGVAAGIAWSRLLPLLSEQRFWQVLTFAAVLLLYAGTTALDASGLFAVLTFGIVLANFSGIRRYLVTSSVELDSSEQPYHERILSFHSELAFLVRTFFFVLIGALVVLSGLRKYALTILGIFGALLLARWLAVKCGRWAWRSIPPEEHEFIFWILPRGLITAVLAIQVVDARGNAFEFLIGVTFAIILLTNFLLVVGSVRARRMPAGKVPSEQPTSTAS